MTEFMAARKCTKLNPTACRRVTGCTFLLPWYAAVSVVCTFHTYRYAYKLYISSYN